MIKRFIVLILFIFMFVLIGCGRVSAVSAVSNDSNNSIFICVERTYAWKIVYHKDTKVMYAVSNYGAGSGVFTLLVDAEGRPLLWENE